MSSNRKNKKNNKKMNHHVLNSYTMEALLPTVTASEAFEL